MPIDYYSDIIRQRTAADAAQILADECRKKDRVIQKLSELISPGYEYDSVAGRLSFPVHAPDLPYLSMARETKED
ncbi:hypothetical protein [Candidatus Igneacidithiobacillus taiwanensis]|uniref:hypothetical protein n=1 Tax=Candidatus Igneacidithiobacillus taiwanensis TaxID=1945924 RepID=UPI002898FF9A|nr:hypothetical protein [Candidatus Igneacidithiobacillus taiwanensis]